MKIEDRWEDYTIWLVGFKTTYIGTEKNRIVHKTLAFDSTLDEKDVSKFVLSNFNNIEGIEYIDMWDEGCLKPKQNSAI